MFRPHRRSRVAAPALAAAILVLSAGLTGCSDDAPDDVPSSSAAPSSGAPDSTTPTTDSPSEPTTEPTTAPTTPSVAPATGEPGKVPGVTARGPRGWLFRQAVSSAVASWVDADTFNMVTISSGLNLSKRAITTDEEADRAQRTEPMYTERLPDTTVLDQPAYRVVGTYQGRYVTQIGVLLGERAISVSFEFVPDTVSESEREEIIASVVASLKQTSS